MSVLVIGGAVLFGGSDRVTDASASRVDTGISAPVVQDRVARSSMAEADSDYPAIDDLRLRTTAVATGLEGPVLVTSPQGEVDRFFVVEQAGRIRIVQDGVLIAEPFLDVTDRVHYAGERGLLGLAFHPSYADNGRFFVNYTDTSSNTVIAEFLVSEDANRADPESEEPLMAIDQPFINHNGGMLAFGADGYLYLGTGDGGGLGDPGDRAQDLSTLLGKMLRIDVDGAGPYEIPEDNPFVGTGFLEEIWATGLRNPWRFSVDRETGDLYIADVGQAIWEEVSFEPFGIDGGRNYGWRLKEGTHCYSPPVDCDDPGLTDPVYEYPHGGNPYSCSITGGYVYRGPTLPELDGVYLFADYCSARVWSFRMAGDTATELAEHTDELAPGGDDELASISSFGEDGVGEVYVCDLFGGEVYRISRRLDAQVPGLTGGETATVDIRGATPNATVRVVYSVAGEGHTYVPDYRIHASLENPRLAGSIQVDATGRGVYSQRVPPQARGRTVWIQVLQAGGSSDVSLRAVQ